MKQTITLHTGTDAHEVMADVRGSVALHTSADNKKMMTITHVASGLRIVECVNKPEARAILTELAALDWTAVDAAAATITAAVDAWHASGCAGPRPSPITSIDPVLYAAICEILTRYGYTQRKQAAQ